MVKRSSARNSHCNDSYDTTCYLIHETPSCSRIFSSASSMDLAIIYDYVCIHWDRVGESTNDWMVRSTFFLFLSHCTHRGGHLSDFYFKKSMADAIGSIFAISLAFVYSHVKIIVETKAGR